MKTKRLENSGQCMAISNDPNTGDVTIKFDAPVTFMRFSPEDARRLAKDLIANARKLELKTLQ